MVFHAKTIHIQLYILVGTGEHVVNNVQELHNSLIKM